MKKIGTIHTSYKEKFGIPRQAGLVEQSKADIVLEPEFRNPDVYRGIEEFSHLWLLWEFSEVVGKDWSPLVRPPRLGGNEKKGVFATRSPFRPNPVGLSCVRLESIEWDTPQGPILHVLGADCMDGTPIYDIKPYIPYADCHTDATSGFAPKPEASLKVLWGEGTKEVLSMEEAREVEGVLAQDPRPHYQHDPERVYGLSFGHYNIRFRVEEPNCIITSIEKSKA